MQTRREILASLGSNHQLNDKNLCIDLCSWLSVLKKSENELDPKNERFELERVNEYNAISTFNPISTLKLAQEDKVRIANSAISTPMQTVIEKVRAELLKSPQLPYIPDLSEWIDKMPKDIP